jgi:hypothetical protein
MRLSPHTAAACQDPITVVSFRLPTSIHWYTGAGSYFDAPDKLWPFAMYAAFPRSDYYGHADSPYGHRRIWHVFPRA